MSEKYTIKDVTNDLGFLLTLTKVFAMDDKGFWVDYDTQKRFEYDLDGNGEGKEVVVFQDPLPKGDYYFFNPFAEGFGKKTPAVQLFYKTIRLAFNLNVRTALLYAASQLLISKTEKDTSLSSAVVRITSVPVDKKSMVFDVIDDKMIDEFAKIFDNMQDEILFVPYYTNMMTAKVKVEALTDWKSWEEKYGEGIRKKSLAAFRAMLMGILGIKHPDDLEEFNSKYDPALKSSARLHTTMDVYLKLYTRFNDVLEDAFVADGAPAERNEINLGQLQEVIDRFPLAYAIAKHMVQPALPKKEAHDTTTADTSKLSLASPTGGRRFPGPAVIDEFGRQVRQNEVPVIGRTDHKSRFSPHVLSEVPVDPFAPAVRAAPHTSGPFGSPSAFGAPSGFGGGMAPTVGSFGQSQGSYFGGGSNFGGGGGLNLGAPSNFGAPGARRYF